MKTDRRSLPKKRLCRTAAVSYPCLYRTLLTLTSARTSDNRIFLFTN